MATIKKIKIKQPDGNYGEYVNIGALAENVILGNNNTVEQAIEDINNAGYITKEVTDLTNYYNKDYLDSNFTTNNTSSSFITKDVTDLKNYYTKTQMDAKLAGGIRYKGSVNSYDDLAALSGSAQIGDMYNIETESEHNKAGDDAVWNGSTWDITGGVVDLSDYAKLTDLPDLVPYLKSADAAKTYATIENLNTASGSSVKLSGNQTIDGVKTFKAIPVLPNTDPTAENQAVNKKYVDNQLKGYLPLSGGTLTTSQFNGLQIKRSDTSGSSMLFSNSTGSLGHIGFTSSGTLVVTKGSGTAGTADLLAIDNTGVMTAFNHINPSTNNAVNLGSESLKYANVYATNLIGNAATATKVNNSLTLTKSNQSYAFNGSANVSVAIPTIHSGSTEPDVSLGADGDLYIQID